MIKDCACLIHGGRYDWIYVERLFNMLQRNSQHEIKLHVFTEPERPVPDHMIKHELVGWPGVEGPRKAWWYKMQMFDQRQLNFPVLYLDLDTVIVDNIDWIWESDLLYFWAIHDFRRLWRASSRTLNSSVMYWDPKIYYWIWDDFAKQNLDVIMRRNPGDQDYLTKIIPETHLRFFDHDLVRSWRWEIVDGGLDFLTRKYRCPNAGAQIKPGTGLVIFHGSPKPHEINDNTIAQHWI